LNGHPNKLWQALAQNKKDLVSTAERSTGTFVLVQSTNFGVGGSKKGREGAPAERFPDFDYLVDDHGCEAHRHPDARRFDGQFGPRTDLPIIASSRYRHQP
jgi:hypothetical protein